MENVIAVVPDAVDVVDGLGEAAGIEAALVVLHELLEAVLVELLVFHVKVLVLLHVGLVLEGEVAAAAVAVKVGRLLVAEGAVRRAAVLLTTEPDVKSKCFESVTYLISVSLTVHKDILLQKRASNNCFRLLQIGVTTN